MLSSWVPGADGSGFPAEHLPYGVFSAGGGGRQVGARIGDQVLDLGRLAAVGVAGLEPWAPALGADRLNPFLAAGPDAWRQVREALTELVCSSSARAMA
jgi:fumarylacetoacetase